jgi:spoIIIJ-associated protein
MSGRLLRCLVVSNIDRGGATLRWDGINIMNDLQQSAETVASLMRLMTTTGGLQLKYRITAGAGAADPDGVERRQIYVECRGPDAPLLLARDGELLYSLEHIAAKMLRLDPEDVDLISFDAEGFKAARARTIREAAAAAIAHVRTSGQPHRFQPMTARDRRALHLFLHASGLRTASSGDMPQRFVTLYPDGFPIQLERPNGDERRRFIRHR